MRPIPYQSAIRAALIAMAVALPSARPALAQPASSASAQRGQTTIVAFRSDLPQSERAINATPEQVVQAAKMVYAQVGLPLLQSSDNARDVFTPYLRVQRHLFGRNNSDFFACQVTDLAGGNMADRGTLTFAILMRVRPAGASSVLMTQVDARVTRRDVSANSVECSSTGALEKALIDMIEQIIRDTAPPSAGAQPPQP
ncbi:MAG TPA: hypothetical protein VFJ16_28230 [Longimicrobium sp.]|nr:hypothetical protein [Longimicrobium sp.]